MGWPPPWIHVLEDSELAFVLMLACLRSRFDKMPVFATRLFSLSASSPLRDGHRAASHS
jgi:hypothetical protein